jgi:hypothetical protein
MSQSTTVQNLRAAPESQMPVVAPGFGSLQSFELMQRAANLLASSTLVPVAYRKVIEKTNRFGDVTETRENPNALANSVVALNMAQRMGADPLMVMQNLHPVEGRPSWSSQWIIAAINGCGRFAPLRYDVQDLGIRKVQYTTFEWSEDSNGRKQRRTVTNSLDVHDKVCIAWTVERGVEIPRFPAEQLRGKSLLALCRENGIPVIESPAVSIEMAVKEGWFTKNGSKWQTMPDVMLRYRSASFFGRLYAPELLMGLQTVEEAQDIIEATTGPDGTISVNVDDLRASAAPIERQSATAPADVTDVEARDTQSAQDSSPAKEQAEAGKSAQGAATAAPAAQEEVDGDEQASPAESDPGLDPAAVEHQIVNAKSLDVLDLASDSIEGVNDLEERARLHQLYQARRLSMTSQQQRTATATRRRMAAPE